MQPPPARAKPELDVDPVELESNPSDEDFQEGAEADAEPNDGTLDDLDDEDQPLDEDDLENEFDEEDIAPVVKKEKKRTIKTEEGVQKDVKDEVDDTVFIDNLPKDERSIRIMLKDVNRHIRDLEKKFFEEEDSEAEEELKQELECKDVSAAEHNQRLE